MRLGERMGALGQPALSSVIHLDSSVLPDIRNWKPGGRYRITLEVEQLDMSYGDSFGANFKVLSAKPQYGGGPMKQEKDTAFKDATMNALAAKAARNY